MVRYFRTKEDAQDYASRITPQSFGTPTRKLIKQIKLTKTKGWVLYIRTKHRFR